ncbi:galactokinase [Nevskia soli]|jgi:galactokinase|uniref:galactokinase n=1 Tax=Nevskia soli TaxID=418856 RepID=UPI0015D6D0D1|nr:galactokinase [Nevskia soli]
MIDEFRKLFPDLTPRFFRAPGRVNLIGEHTDYNMGFVMPIALDMNCYVAVAGSNDRKTHIHSLDRGEGFDFDPDVAFAKPRKNWTDYVIGVAQQLSMRGVRILPMSMVFHSEVPEGSGLSSSAALEVSAALAFLNGRTYSGVEMAKLCQRAEIDFVGNPCGIMDQYISVFGEANRALELDCRSLSHKPVELPANAALLAVNSMVKHDLATSAYGDRVKECKAAVAGIARLHPEVKALRDAKLEYLENARLDPTVEKRARHIITEDDRVEQFFAAARRGDLDQMGKLFVASHRSMQHDYEISCEEIDFLVDTALTIDGVYGSRMTGGGFGGCTINLVRPDRVDAFTKEIVDRYQARYNKQAPVFNCVPSSGAREVKDLSTIPATNKTSS